MKGIAIYESPFMGEMYVRAVDIRHANYTFESATTEDASVSLSGYFSKSSQAKCSKKDTYDFETGALISLMRMCGLEKSAKAYAEIFDDTAYGDALIERDKLKQLLEYTKNDINKKLRYIKELEEEIEILRDNNKALTEVRNHFLSESTQRLRDKIDLKTENEKLKDEVRFKKDAINELKRILNGTNYKIGELVCENEKLRTDCEKLRKGYLDTDMIFCGGRQNGKQYTFLVDLFKKIDQKKVDTAYKEAYNTTLPVWQKEVLKQMYDIRKESKEKIELPRTLDINGTVYRKSIQIKDFGEQIKLAEESSTKPWFTTQPENFSFEIKHVDSDVLDTLRGCQKKPDVSKREKMWDYILAPGRTSIYVKAEDVADFLDECTIVGVTWITGVAPNKQRPYFSGEGVYFFIDSKGNHLMTWQNTEPCLSEAEAKADVNYIRPMRWDLFEKGRVYIRVKAEHFDEFQKACKAHLECGKVPLSPFHYYSNGDVIVCYTDEHFRLTKTLKGFKKRPVVNWEDVR